MPCKSNFLCFVLALCLQWAVALQTGFNVIWIFLETGKPSFLMFIFLQEPEKHHVPFQGVGRTLGSSSTAASEPTVDSTPVNTASSSSEGLVVDENLPSTSVQIRLADGTRLIAHFNLHHTISDIHSFIDASRPGTARNYQLQMMGFPPKVLADRTQNIEQAGLANSVVIQKF